MSVRKESLHKMVTSLNMYQMDTYVIRWLHNALSYNCHAPQINYKTFCELFSFYVCGGLFKAFPNHPNKLLNNLRKLGIVKTVRYTKDTTTSMVLGEERDPEAGIDMVFADPDPHVSEALVALTHPMYLCLSDWHIIPSFTRLMAKISKNLDDTCKDNAMIGNPNYRNLYYDHAATEPIRDYTDDNLFDVSLAKDDVDSEFRKVWSDHNLSLTDLFYNIGTKNLYNFASHTSIVNMNRFLQYMNDSLFDSKYNHSDGNFFLSDVYCEHQDYIDTYDLTRDPLVI